ncbi:MAG TPA: hypothetical protein VKX41_19750 [Alloacidobacterium sp.]|jgi:hypothetical protein|nr:hypothetical protein [Alloacidobacterium sp.]
MMTVRKSGSLSWRVRMAIYVTGVGVWLTGGLWLLYHYFLVKQGEFGPETNPLEPWWLKLHGAFAFAAMWLFGLLWGVHISKAWPHKRRRWSGGVTAGLLIWLTLSGYLLYYIGDERIRPVVSLLHWVVGLGLPLAFLWHRVRVRRRSRVEMRSSVVRG